MRKYKGTLSSTLLLAGALQSATTVFAAQQKGDITTGVRIDKGLASEKLKELTSTNEVGDYADTTSSVTEAETGDEENGDSDDNNGTAKIISKREEELSVPNTEMESTFSWGSMLRNHWGKLLLIPAMVYAPYYVILPYLVGGAYATYYNYVKIKGFSSLSNAWEAIKNKSSGLVNGIKNIVNGVWSNTFLDAIINKVNGFSGAIQEIGSILANVEGSLKKGDDVEGVKKQLQSLYGKATEKLEDLKKEKEKQLEKLKEELKEKRSSFSYRLVTSSFYYSGTAEEYERKLKERITACEKEYDKKIEAYQAKCTEIEQWINDVEYLQKIYEVSGEIEKASNAEGVAKLVKKVNDLFTVKNGKGKMYYNERYQKDGNVVNKALKKVVNGLFDHTYVFDIKTIENMGKLAPEDEEKPLIEREKILAQKKENLGKYKDTVAKNIEKYGRIFTSLNEEARKFVDSSKEQAAKTKVKNAKDELENTYKASLEMLTSLEKAILEVIKDLGALNENKEKACKIIEKINETTGSSSGGMMVSAEQVLAQMKSYIESFCKVYPYTKSVLEPYKKILEISEKYKDGQAKIKIINDGDVGEIMKVAKSVNEALENGGLKKLVEYCGGRTNEKGEFVFEGLVAIDEKIKKAKNTEEFVKIIGSLEVLNNNIPTAGIADYDRKSRHTLYLGLRNLIEIRINELNSLKEIAEGLETADHDKLESYLNTVVNTFIEDVFSSNDITKAEYAVFKEPCKNLIIKMLERYDTELENANPKKAFEFIDSVSATLKEVLYKLNSVGGKDEALSAVIDRVQQGSIGKIDKYKKDHEKELEKLKIAEVQEELLYTDYFN